MLLELGLSNYRSFRDKVSLSLVASREQKFRDRLPRFESRYQISVAPIAAVFGANASGKTNLIQALDDLRELLLDPPRPAELIPYRPFKLDADCLDAPSLIEVLFSWEDVIFEYSLSFNRHKIIREKLTRYLSKKEDVLFERFENEPVFVGEAVRSAKVETHLEGIVGNMPVVAYLAGLNKESIKNWNLMVAPFLWMKNVLVMPAGIFDPHLSPQTIGTQLQTPIPDEILEAIDIGVSGFEREPVEFSSLKLPEEFVDYVRSRAERIGGALTIEFDSGRYEINLDVSGALSAKRVRLLHQGENGQFPLDWGEESDGTKAVIRLLGIFVTLALEKSSVMLVIDELDRSFHTELSRALIDGFLATCDKDSRAQLLFSTHDLLLMDPNRLRKDEMWVTEKNYGGSSTLIGIAEYRGVRSDSDLRKSYLAGRFGGVPSLEPFDLVSWAATFGEVGNEP